ncbi:MAG: hypothetical protein MJZ14_00855 [Paludibacteraceae bacterium]|nr:hypothetical protein [Paludibacteraceae bacterium]
MLKLLPENFTLHKYGLDVRLVDESDAEFIVSIRTTDKANSVIHRTDNDVDKQVDWIREYKNREKEGREYYFLFSKNGVKQGVTRIYHIHETDFTTGSWVFSQSAENGAGILADIISREIGFSLNPGSINLFDVRSNNTNVQRYRLSYNPTYLRTDDENNMFYSLSQENFEKKKQVYIRMLYK